MMNRITAILYKGKWYSVLAYNPGYIGPVPHGQRSDNAPGWLIGEKGTYLGVARDLRWITIDQIEQAQFESTMPGELVPFVEPGQSDEATP